MWVPGPLCILHVYFLQTSSFWPIHHKRGKVMGISDYVLLFFFFLFAFGLRSLRVCPIGVFFAFSFLFLMVWRMYYSWGGAAIRPGFSRGSFDGDLGRWMAERENSRKSRWESGRAGSEQRQQDWRDVKGRIRVVWPGSRAGRIWCSSRE